MNYILITHNKSIAMSIARHIKYLIDNIDVDIVFFNEKINGVGVDLKNSDIIIIDNFTDFPNNYANWRYAKRLIDGKKKFLLLFLDTPQKFPDEGSFWLKINKLEKLNTKIQEIIQQPALNIKDFEKWEQKFPEFLKENINSHYSDKLFITKKG